MKYNGLEYNKTKIKNLYECINTTKLLSYFHGLWEFSVLVWHSSAVTQLLAVYGSVWRINMDWVLYFNVTQFSNYSLCGLAQHALSVSSGWQVLSSSRAALTSINKYHGFDTASSASSAQKSDVHYWEKGAFRLLVAHILWLF